MTLNKNLCKFLDWDSEFFGCRIASLINETLTTNRLKKALSWCGDNQIDCLYFLADIEDSQTIMLAEKQGFHLTDIRVTLEAELSGIQQYQTITTGIVQNATSEDFEQLKKIASVNHRDSRFYYDGNFSIQKCDELFATWIEKSCKGYADVVLTKKSGKKIEGYITCSIDEEGNGSIGLVGVNPYLQGKGIGRVLVSSAIEWFKSKNVSYFTVITQGRNVKAQRLYQRNGFVTKSLKNWYHLWFV